MQFVQGGSGGQNGHSVASTLPIDETRKITSTTIAFLNLENFIVRICLVYVLNI
jgi:hypothetical protein